MGTAAATKHHGNTKVLLAVVVSLALAVAEPEAEPTTDANPSADPWYSYGYGLGHHGYGLGYYGLGHGYYGLGHGYLGYGGYWGRKKREAVAEPTAEANPSADPCTPMGTG